MRPGKRKRVQCAVSSSLYDCYFIDLYSNDEKQIQPYLDLMSKTREMKVAAALHLV